MENLLYYPYINLPKTDWSVRCLLYYDQIGSIVPIDYFYKHKKYEVFMEQLIKEELVIPINPYDELYNPSEIVKIFIDYIHNSKFNIDKRRENFRERKFRRINENKFDAIIFDRLYDAKLAKRENYPWILVEEYTAMELMTFLATVIGDKLNYQPMTDIELNHFELAGSEYNFIIRETESQKREIILNELIPFPKDIDIKKIRSFKDKHFELLKTFKNKVELIALDSNIDINSELFKEKVTELNEHKKELSDKMSESRFGAIFFGTICGVVGATMGLLTTSTTGAFLGALPGFTNAIYSAMQIEKPEKIRDQSGLKYLALVDKRIRKNVSR